MMKGAEPFIMQLLLQSKRLKYFQSKFDENYTDSNITKHWQTDHPYHFPDLVEVEMDISIGNIQIHILERVCVTANRLQTCSFIVGNGTHDAVYRAMNKAHFPELKLININDVSEGAPIMTVSLNVARFNPIARFYFRMVKASVVNDAWGET